MPITPPPPQHRRDGQQGPTIDPPGPTKNPGHRNLCRSSERGRACLFIATGETADARAGRVPGRAANHWIQAPDRRIGAHKNCGGRGRVGTQINSSVRRGLPADRRDWNSGRIGVRSSWPAPLLSVIMAPMPAVGLVRRVPGLETAVGRGDRRCRQRTSQQRLARFSLTCACPMWRGQRWGPSSLTVPAAMVGARENLACERTGCGPPGQSAREPGHGERGCALRDRRA